ncbi:hypothetical protein [Streptomyces erythrochromogenes]|uniref:hypothetical protein n=1 Tax=Streptomyces erythrochromogenes TaxID=285574 RepID=UPI0038051E1B
MVQSTFGRIPGFGNRESCACVRRQGLQGPLRHLVSQFAAVVVISALAWLGMTALAGTISSDGQGHDHGSTTGTPAKPGQNGHSHSH